MTILRCSFSCAFAAMGLGLYWGGARASVQADFRGERVGPGVISTDADETFPTINPDGSALYFSKVKEGQGWPNQIIVVSELREGRWLAPQVVPFSGTEYSDRAARLSPDGGRLFFTSNRPVQGHDFDPRDYNIWVTDLSSQGTWTEPHRLDESVNTSSSEIHSSVTGDGTLYFASARPGGHGRSDVYRARLRNGEYQPAENLGSPINTEQSQSDVYLSPAGDMMILAITDHPDGFGGDDLHVSFLRGGHWSAPENLGGAVNTPEYEYGPTVSPDGEFLYFTSHTAGSADVYRIRLDQLPAFRR